MDGVPRNKGQLIRDLSVHPASMSLRPPKSSMTGETLELVLGLSPGGGEYALLPSGSVGMRVSISLSGEPFDTVST